MLRAVVYELIVRDQGSLKLSVRRHTVRPIISYTTIIRQLVNKHCSAATHEIHARAAVCIAFNLVS